MDATTPELEQALLACVNKFDLSKPVSAWKDLQDGHLFWQMLVSLDPKHFTGELPESESKTADSWISRWQNLKYVDKAMTTYLREVCQSEGLVQLLNPDLKAIAIDGDVVQTQKMLKGMLMLAFSSDVTNPRMLEIVSSIQNSHASQIAIMAGQINSASEKALESRKEQESVEDDIPSDPESKADPIQRDPELEREEHLIKANQKIKTLETKLAEAVEDLEEQRKRSAQLEEELIESRLLLDNRGRRDADDDEVAQLKHQADKDRDYIAQIESNLVEAQRTIENQGRALERLKADAETKQELRDENQLLKAERDELIQKCKGMENLRKKVEYMTEQVKSQQTLEQRLQSMTEEQQELDQLREQNAKLRKMNEEQLTTLGNCEQEIFESKQTRTRLEHELKAVSTRLESATTMANRYQVENQQLEERVRELEDRTTGTEALAETLEDQLKDDVEVDARSPRKSIMTIDNADVVLLQQKVDLLTARCQRVEEKYLDVFQENLGLQAALQDEKSLKEGLVITIESDHILDNMANYYSDDPFVHQTNKLHTAEGEVKELTNKVHAISAKNMELQAKLAELSGTGKMDGASGADHSAMKENYEQLLATHDELQKHAEKLDNELDDWKALLRHKLLNSDVLRQEDAEALASNEYKLLLEQLGLYREASDEESEQIKMAIASDVIKKLSSGLADLSSRDKRIADMESMIKTLKANLERIKKEAGDKASVEVQKELQALQRENKLIMSAWYDMANRLQSNTVVLQRTKTETPKSWLGRQRMEASRGIAAGLGGIGASMIYAIA